MLQIPGSIPCLAKYSSGIAATFSRRYARYLHERMKQSRQERALGVDDQLSPVF
jgi:hypothetical protein